MRIHSPSVQVAGGRAHLRTLLESGDAPSTLWYSVPDSHASMLAPTCDAPLVAMLLPAMARGEDVEVTGPLSEQLHFGLPLLQAVLRQVMPFLRPITVRASNLQSSRHTDATGVATGFSGGIDSFCVLADHHYGNVAPGYRLTHLLCNNVGSHGTGGQATFRRRYERMRQLAQRLGLPYIDVDSNLDDFYPERLDFRQTNTLRNASVALALGGGIGRFLYASTYHIADCGAFAYHDCSTADLLTLPLLSTQSTQCLSVGSDSTRVEKTLRVAEIADSHDFLDVCTKMWTERNCVSCSKCKRALLTLEIAGLLPRYERVFDLPAWRRVRAGYIGRVFQDRGDPFAHELVALARRAGLRRSAWSHLYGLAWRGKEALKHALGPPHPAHQAPWSRR